jgi:tetratricopeptide (TPR) repeat protein
VLKVGRLGVGVRVVVRVAFVLTLVLASARAAAQDDESNGALRRPERLTVGVADDLLGQLGSDAKTLYFVSNRNTSSQIFAQTVADGRARQLFDDDADVTWPRVSPDGSRLLYISFGERAFGQLCVRDLPDGGGRRCLEDASTALQAEWIDGGRIALVSRQSIHGDLRVLDVTVGKKLEARPLLSRNLTSPAVSPDGRWLVYVPVERAAEAVGPAFASHAASRLEIASLASPESPAVALALDLPGLTGQPTFARDGRSLYVVQFFADSNHDGVIDASDHGVLFRVPLSTNGGVPDAGAPEQLTDTSWNCEYPAPARDRLIATCSQDKDLDVYALPLDGEVPTDWTAERLGEEIANAATRVEQQLLSSRRLARETTPGARRVAMLSLAMVHLDLEEYRAAEFYAERVAALHDPETAGVSHPLLMLVDQRRAARNRERGRMIGQFGELARKRLEGLQLKPGASAMAVAFAHVVRSEIADSIGDITQARTELEAVTLDRTTPAAIVEAYCQRADAFYRTSGDREALADLARRLSESEDLSPDAKLRYARAAVRAMVRGLPSDDAAARLARERQSSADGSELAFTLDLVRAVLGLRDAHPPQAVRDALLALYAAQTRPDRRLAIVEDTVRRATEVGADGVVEHLAQSHIEAFARGTRERDGAERLYRRVMTGRAYRRAAERRFDEARADFDAIVAQTGSYEAVVGSIDMRIKAGEATATIRASYAKSGIPPALSRFATAYVLARELPKLEGDAFEKADADALVALHASWSELKEKRIVQALDGALLHEEYLRTGDLADAEKANVHYLIALELVGNNPRFRAMILGQLGLLHTQVGNYRIALGYLVDRDKLPYTDNAEGLAVHLAKARCLLHVGRDAEAAATADEAVAMTERTPAQAPYRALALDRAAVDNVAAGRFARALALYDEEIPRVDAESGPLAGRNRFVVRVSRAAAAVGAGQPARALVDLGEVDRDLSDPKRIAELQWPHASIEHVVRSYRLIATGLRAKASGALGQLEDEERAILSRHAILDDRFTRTKRAEYERDEMLVETQLALNASQRHDLVGSAKWIGSALARADDLRARANGDLDKDQLDVLRLAAELTVASGALLVPDLGKRLQATSAELTAKRETAPASFATYARWFEIDLPLVGERTPAGP